MADLQNPIMPVVDTSAVTRGLQFYAEGRKQRMANELAMQKMAQDAAIQTEDFALKRQQLAQNMELQNAQIRNYDSEATYRNTVLTDAQKHKSDALASLSPLQQQVDSVPYADLGTDKGYATLSEIFNDPAHEPALQTPQGLKIRSNAWSRQRLAESRRADDYRIANSAFDQSLKKIGIDEGLLNSLSLDGKKITTSGNIWRTNPADGSAFVAVAPKTGDVPARYLTTEEYAPGTAGVSGTKANIAPPGTAFVTVKPDDLSQLFQMRNMVQNYRKKLPLGALQDAHAQQIGDQQQAQQNRAVTAGIAPAPTDLKSRAQQALNDPNATPQEKAAAQQILSQ